MKFKRKYYLILVALIFVIVGCKEPPEFEKIMVSPDTTKIVYLFSIKTRLSQGRMSNSIVNTFFDVYDINTGEKINAEPAEVEERGMLQGISNKSILVNSYDVWNKKDYRYLYDIKTGQLTIGGEDLEKKCNMKFTPLEDYVAPDNNPGIAVMGDDSREYVLTDNGMLIPLQIKVKKKLTENVEFENSLRIDSLRIEFTSDNRPKLVNEVRIRKEGEYIEQKETSLMDFINPSILSIEKSVLEAEPIFFDHKYVIHSCTKTSNGEHVFTCFQLGSVKAIWNSILSNPLASIKEEEIKWLCQLNNNLIIITDQSINSIDLKTGKWNYNVRLINELEE